MRPTKLQPTGVVFELPTSHEKVDEAELRLRYPTLDPRSLYTPHARPGAAVAAYMQHGLYAHERLPSARPRTQLDDWRSSTTLVASFTTAHDTMACWNLLSGRGLRARITGPVGFVDPHAVDEFHVLVIDDGTPEPGALLERTATANNGRCEGAGGAGNALDRGIARVLAIGGDEPL